MSASHYLEALKYEVQMGQSISAHVVRLLAGRSGVILLLENDQEITISGDCMPADLLERLQLGDRVWYFPEPGERPDSRHSGRLIPIPSRHENYAYAARARCSLPSNTIAKHG
jgi:hypothetical protein